MRGSYDEHPHVDRNLLAAASIGGLKPNREMKTGLVSLDNPADFHRRRISHDSHQEVQAS